MRVSVGLYKNHKLTTPKGSKTRPTSEKLRQTVFNICQHAVADAAFLDVFAGSGAMGIEALSRGARHATFIENNRQALHAIKKNLSRLQLTDQGTILSLDVLKALKLLEKKREGFDLIYIDPPYGQKVKESSETYLDAVLSFIDQSNLLSEKGIFFCQEATQPTISLSRLVLDKKRQVGDTYLYQCYLR